MILLFGGTSETAPLTESLARAGYHVLVSMATDIELAVGAHPRIELRRGRLNAEQMIALVRGRGIHAIVDATHPFASAVRATASHVAREAGIPYLTFLRPGGLGDGDGVILVETHEQAARLACEMGKPVLLTIGSRNVAPYAKEARRVGIPLVARVLDHPDSLKSCDDAGIPADCVLTGRGPFSVEENRRVIKKYNIGVLVTKDSGDAGGVREKLEAARLEGCSIIVVERPEQTTGFENSADLLAALQVAVPVPRCKVLAMDLESVLIPEIWETVARHANLPELALTTRDIADYEALMKRRIALCREHGLTIMRLREIVASMEPLPGALEFLAWAQSRALVAVVSDTFHELAGPILSKIGSPLTICNSLTLDAAGYISGFTLREPAGKAGAVARFQRNGWRVTAVGDSFNDLPMLKSADAAFLFRPAQCVAEAATAFRPIGTFDDLQTQLATVL